MYLMMDYKTHSVNRFGDLGKLKASNFEHFNSAIKNYIRFISIWNVETEGRTQEGMSFKFSKVPEVTKNFVSIRKS